jgi:hypothetical protein
MQSDLEFFVDGIEDAQESWKAGHEDATECRNIEDTVRRGIGYFYMIRFAVESWSKKVQRGAIQFDPAQALAIRQRYQSWLKPCDQVLFGARTQRATI